MTFNFDMTIWHIAYFSIVRMHEAYFTILLFDFGGKELYFWRYVDKNSYLNVWILIYVNERDSLFLIHLYKNSNSISSRCIFWCVFVAIIWSNQIKRGRSYYVFQKSSELWTRCTCTKLARDVWTRYILYFYPRAGGAKRRARVLIPPGYLHPGKRKH
jgi:hypothetical protein